MLLHRLRRAGLAVVTTGAIVVATAVVAPTPTDAEQAAATDAVPVLDRSEVWAHLEQFAAIAAANGGTRSTGTPGFERSVDYVSDHLRAAGYTVTHQTFDADVSVSVQPATLRIPSATGIIELSGPDDVLASVPAAPGDAVAPIFDVDDGCDAGDWATFPEGAVAYVSTRGVCGTFNETLAAYYADASGVVFAADCTSCAAQRVEYMGDVPMPAVSLSSAATEALDEAMGTGPILVAVDTGHELQSLPTTNVIAERAGTDPGAGVVMLGSHLDSMPAGPGINDPASGVAALLELADGIAAAETGPTVRFGFWAGEELGLLGSLHHVAGLSPAELAEIRAYLNLDMIGSPNWATFVYDPAVAVDPRSVSAGSAELSERFYAWFAERGRPTLPVWTEGRSDDGPFARAGVPVGGVFSGAEEIKTAEQAVAFGGTAGVAFDPCYHLSCDTLDNVSMEGLMLHAEALVAVAAELLAAPAAPDPGSDPDPAPLRPARPARTTTPIAPRFAG